MAKAPPPDSPFIGIDDYTTEDVSAVQMWASGQDLPGHIARRLWNLVIHVYSRVGDQSYRPGRNGDTDFMEGRRFVGLQLNKLATADIDTVRAHESRGRTKQPGRDPGRNPEREVKPE